MPASDPDPCLHRLLAGQGDLPDFPRAGLPVRPRPVGEIKIDQTKGWAIPGGQSHKAHGIRISMDGKGNWMDNEWGPPRRLSGTLPQNGWILLNLTVPTFPAACLRPTRALRSLGLALLAACVILCAAARAQDGSSGEPPPDLQVSTLVSGLSIPWDLAFTPDGTMLFTQRAGVLSSRLADGTVQTIDAEFGDLFASGETGLTGIVADPDFTSNRRFYTCQGHTGPEVQVIAWSINASSRTTSES